MSSLRQGSLLSFGSTQLSSKHEEEINFDDMTDEDVQKALEQTIENNQILAIENEIFERYLRQQDPQTLQTVAQLLEVTKQTQKLAAASSSTTLSGNVTNVQDKGSISGSSTASASRYTPSSLLTRRELGRGLKVNLAHRMEMANSQLSEMRKKLKKLERTSRKQKADLRVKIEEMEIRMREAHEAKEELEENVEKEVDPLTGKIPAEKFVKFIEEWLKTADSVIEKLRLRTTTIKTQIRKTKQQLIQREELGEALRPVDFEQLKIENQEFVKKIEEKNRFLLEMKRIAGHHSLLFARHKEKVANLSSTLERIKEDVILNQTKIDKFRSDHGVIQNELEKAEEQLNSLLTLMDEYKAPDVLDFVKMKTEFVVLNKTYKQLIRRKKILQISFKSHKNQMMNETPRESSSLLQ